MYSCTYLFSCFFFFQAEDGIRDHCVTGVQTCALPIWLTSKFFAVTSTKVRTAESGAGAGSSMSTGWLEITLLGTGFEATTILRTRRPVRASAWTTETNRGTTATLRDSSGRISARRLIAARPIATTVHFLKSKQKCILLFYPIIPGFLHSARPPVRFAKSRQIHPQ